MEQMFKCFLNVHVKQVGVVQVVLLLDDVVPDLDTHQVTTFSMYQVHTCLMPTTRTGARH